MTSSENFPARWNPQSPWTLRDGFVPVNISLSCPLGRKVLTSNNGPRSAWSRGETHAFKRRRGWALPAGGAGCVLGQSWQPPVWGRALGQSHFIAVAVGFIGESVSQVTYPGDVTTLCLALLNTTKGFDWRVAINPSNWKILICKHPCF